MKKYISLYFSLFFEWSKIFTLHSYQPFIHENENVLLTPIICSFSKMSEYMTLNEIKYVKKWNFSNFANFNIPPLVSSNKFYSNYASIKSKNISINAQFGNDFIFSELSLMHALVVLQFARGLFYTYDMMARKKVITF